jgi:hypothetical protein
MIITSSAAVALFYSEVSRPFRPWYYTGLVTLIAASAETAIIASVRTPLVRGTIIAFSFMVLAFGISPAWASLESAQTNLDVIAAQIGKTSSRSDLVVVSPWFLSIAFDRYFRGQAPVTTVPAVEQRQVHRYDLVKAIMMSPAPLSGIETDIENTLKAGHRVWIVCNFQPPRQIVEPPPLPVPPLADSGWNVAPYQLSWSLHVYALLQQHAGILRSLPVLQPGGEFENGYLFVAEGWR